MNTLADLLTALRQILRDPQAAVWSDAELTHALRQGLQRYVAPDLLEVATLSDYVWLAPLAPVVTMAALVYNRVYQTQAVDGRLGATARRIMAEVVEGDQRIFLGPPREFEVDKLFRALVKLGIATGASLEGAVHSHTRRAREAGCTPDEIRQVVLLATTTLGFPSMMAALSWVDDVLNRA